jgi:uncharacterized membrane protein (UPF0127 family)
MRDFSLFETQGFFFQGNVFELAIADTPQLREQGLSYVINMQENEGMLFVFEDASTYGFWMKGMQFPLDIMWLNPEGVVVYLEENLSPDTYPETFAPNIPSLYVLEMNVGFIEKYDVKVGDKLL